MTSWTASFSISTYCDVVDGVTCLRAHNSPLMYSGRLTRSPARSSCLGCRMYSVPTRVPGMTSAGSGFVALRYATALFPPPYHSAGVGVHATWLHGMAGIERRFWHGMAGCEWRLWHGMAIADSRSIRQCVSRVTQRVCIAPQTTTDREKGRGCDHAAPAEHCREKEKGDIQYPSSRIP